MRQRQIFDSISSTYFLAGAGAPVQRLRAGRSLDVLEWERAVLFRHGALAGTLGPGRHRLLRAGYAASVVDMRPWVLTVPTQEVPTSDGASVKITLAASARVTDPVAFVSAVQSPYESLYLAAQLALRGVVGGLALEELVAARGDIGARVGEAMADVSALGVELSGIEVKDLILPPDLKRAQGEVLVARAQGLAALERARGETAALRSLANAARMASDNPALVQLRLLQELGKTSGHTVVIGAAPFGAPALPGPPGPSAGPSASPAEPSPG